MCVDPNLTVSDEVLDEMNEKEYMDYCVACYDYAKQKNTGEVFIRERCSKKQRQNLNEQMNILFHQLDQLRQNSYRT